jgi:hypothetical protein
MMGSVPCLTNSRHNLFASRGEVGGLISRSILIALRFYRLDLASDAADGHKAAGQRRARDVVYPARVCTLYFVLDRQIVESVM